MFEVPCGRAEADAARCDELFEYRALAVITGSKKPRGRAGLARARIEGKRLGRPPIGSALNESVRSGDSWATWHRIIAERFGVNPSTVQRVSRPFDDASVAVA